MAQDQWTPYAGGLVNGDTNATNNTYAKRGSAGDLAVKALSATVATITGLIGTPVTYTTTATAVPGNIGILLDATAAAFTMTLPPVATSTGQFYLLAKIDSSGNLPTIKGNASETITHGGTAANTYTGLSTQGKMAIAYCDGSTWWIGTLA